MNKPWRVGDYKKKYFGNTRATYLSENYNGQKLVIREIIILNVFRVLNFFLVMVQAI